MKIKEWYKKYEDEVTVCLWLAAMDITMFIWGYYFGAAEESARHHKNALKCLDAYLKEMGV